ncbi:hypothetical protein J4Q44_G00065500 [Coregonus suidteri]|uniref:DUF4683 domain-containing protein n=1 Tax=Coregonus suidteri TaxID=861788 RepID=A0AAN8NBS5_9TELE
MQIYTDLQMHTPVETRMDTHTPMDAHTHTDSAGPEHPRTDSSSEIHTRSSQRQVLLPVNHPACTNQQVASSPCSPPTPHSAIRDRPPAISPAHIGPTPLDLSKPSRAIGPNPPGTSSVGPFCPDPSTIGPDPVEPSPVPVEGERKYALRSSGRPRFPCQLRKSSRIRRSTEDGERRGGRESEREEEEEEEEEKERVSVHVKVERPTVEECLPATYKPVDSALPVAPRPSPRPSPRPTSHSAPRPAPKPRTSTRPQPRPSTNDAKPKAQPRPSMKASPKSSPRPASNPSSRPSTNTVPRPAVKKEVPDDLAPPTKQKRRFVGVRRIVVKVARIPVNLSKRQKSYKISSMETVVGPERGGASGEGGLEGAEGGTAVVREPTALLRMKNNGKSVMVMFPPGELPVILKRRRGRPPKQVVPGMPDKTGGNSTAASGNGEPKKPRRRRQAKLPSPQPSYVNDTNDVKTEYGDVLSKLAFLNHQPPATGRCSPPRCWTPSEPDSFHTPSDNPGISALLHRLTGFRRRGGRGGGVGGRGGGAGGGAGGAGGEGFKSSFSDFFETIGKKRKVTPALSEPGLPKKRGKDDSSDLLDISSSRPDPRKPPPTPGYDSSSTAPGPGSRWSPPFPKRSPKGEPRENQTQASSSSSSRPPYSYYLSQNSPTTSSFPKSTPPSRSLTHSPSSPHPSSYGQYPSGYSSSSPAGGSAAPQRPTDCSFASYGAAGLDKASTAPPVCQGQMGYSNFSKQGYVGYPGQVGPSSPGGGGYMAMAKNSPVPSSSSPEGYRHCPSNQWNYRQGYSGWAWDSLGHHYPGGYSDYVTPGPSEPKDILDISNYTPQKAKRQHFLESLSESSSDSSHLGITGSGGGVSTGGGGGGSGSGSGGGAYRQGGGRESLPIGGEGGQGQSSLSSLEKLMMDWHESASGPSYNWSQNVLFQGQGKPGRGRRKRNAAEPQMEKEGGGGPGTTPDSPTSPPAQTQSHTPTQGSVAKRSGIGGRQARGARGGRGRLSPSPRECPPWGKKALPPPSHPCSSPLLLLPVLLPIATVTAPLWNSAEPALS